MKWKRVSEANFRRTVDTMANLPWPIQFADITALVTERLGWKQWIPGVFKTDLGIDPGGGWIHKLDNNEVSSIRVGLTDYAGDDESDERDTFQHEAFSFYAQILKDMFGPGTHAPFPRKHDEMRWNLPSGARVILTVGIATASVTIMSPRLANAHSIIDRGEH